MFHRVLHFLFVSRVYLQLLEGSMCSFAVMIPHGSCFYHQAYFKYIDHRDLNVIGWHLIEYRMSSCRVKTNKWWSFNAI